MPASGTIKVFVADSEQQAMDWSLALASQEIYATVLQSPEDHRFHVVIDPNDYPRAVTTLLQFQWENSKRSAAIHRVGEAYSFHVGSLAWGVFLAGVYYLDVLSGGSLKLSGFMSERVITAHEWWRLITATWLHGDLGHLLMNILFGCLFLGLAMPFHGAVLTLWISLISGVFGNMVSLAVHGPHFHGLGASGMVMGALGMLSVQTVGFMRQGLLDRRQTFLATMSGIFVFLLVGLSPDTDTVAHTAGFLCGMGLGSVMGLLPSKWLCLRETNYLLAGLLIPLVAAAAFFAWKN